MRLENIFYFQELILDSIQIPDTNSAGILYFLDISILFKWGPEMDVLCGI